VGVAFPPRKTAPATETTRSSHSGTQQQRREGTSRFVSRSSDSSQVEDAQDDTQGDVFMTASSESLRDARNQRSPIFNAKLFTRIGTWNVRTLFQCGRLDQVLEEMQKYKLDILGLSEVRWTGQGRFTSGQATILYSGREKDHYQGVGILLNKNATKALIGWKPVSERIITARFATRHAKITVVQVYAPTESASDSEKDSFYEQLQDELNSIPSYDIKLVIGDFNGKIDDNRRGSYTMIGPHGSAISTNDNGERFALSCCTNGLSIGNMFFRHKRIHKVTWTSPDGGTSNEIDYICISSLWRSSLHDVRTYRGADVGSDHNLVIARIWLRLKKTKVVTSVPPFAIEKLKDPNVVNSFHLDMSNRFATLQHFGDFVEQWKLFQDSIKDSATKTIGRRRGNCGKQENGRKTGQTPLSSLFQRREISSNALTTGQLR